MNVSYIRLLKYLYFAIELDGIVFYFLRCVFLHKIFISKIKIAYIFKVLFN